MRQFKKAVERGQAIANMCPWCIPRTEGLFNCQFDQMNGHYFDLPCSKDDYARCPEHERGERIRAERGW